MTTAIAPPNAFPTRPMTAISTTISTPIGPFTVIARDTGTENPAVLAAGWTGDIADLLPGDRTIAATRAHQSCSSHRRHQRRSVALPRRRARRDRRRCGGTGCGPVPDARLGRAPDGKARKTSHLLRIRCALRPTTGHSGGRVGMCPQCGRIVRSVPSDRANRRFPRWLPVGATGEAVATGSRTSRLRTYGW